jgi:hypothetical protein
MLGRGEQLERELAGGVEPEIGERVGPGVRPRVFGLVEWSDAD